MRYILLLLAVMALLLSACNGGGDSELISIEPFIGGTEGLRISFDTGRPPTETFDDGISPFDVSVKLENNGEFEISQSKVKVTISGILASEFGLSESQLSKNPGEVLLAREKRGNQIIESSPVFVDFNNFNHATPITGAALPFTLRADVCYNYKTTARSKICIRKNLLSPKPDGICEVNEIKETFNSGAPVHVINLQETSRGADRISFSFDITHVAIGNGRIYGLDSSCDVIDRRNENKVFITVSTGLQGLSCSGLSSSGSVASGSTQILGGSKPILCTQDISQPGDYEVPVTIILDYDYENSVSTQIVVKSAK